MAPLERLPPRRVAFLMVPSTNRHHPFISRLDPGSAAGVLAHVVGMDWTTAILAPDAAIAPPHPGEMLGIALRGAVVYHREVADNPVCLPRSLVRLA